MDVVAAAEDVYMTNRKVLPRVHHLSSVDGTFTVQLEEL